MRGPEKTAWSCVRGGSGGEEKALPQEGGGHGEAPQGSGHRPELLELREHLNSILRHKSLDFG